MTKLQLINLIDIMLKNGEILIENTAEAELLLREIRECVCQNIQREIWNDITAQQTGFYFFEHASWKEMLEVQKGSDTDYAIVLQEAFDEDELDVLWNYSHIEEELDDTEIKKEMGVCLEQLKMLELYGKEGNHVMESCRRERLTVALQARLTGLYALLHEGRGL